jgi:RNA polymerase sigma-70 factor, ECF subfamily
MIPTLANGQRAAAAYLRDEDGIHRAFGLGVLTVTRTGIARTHVFSDGPDLVTKFGLPPRYPEITGNTV